ncbi:MAG: hypothetical protein AAGH41_08340 [Pseudomonadota bacterium]
MHRTITSAAAALAALFGAAHAGIGVDASVGTAGLTGNVHVDVFPMVTLRGGVNFFDIDFDDVEYDGIEYDTSIGFTQYGLYADLHPIPGFGSFTLTGGYVFGNRSVDLVSTPFEAVQVGDVIFTPEQVGTLVGRGDLGDSGYYLGFGFDSTTRGFMPIGIVLRAGVIIGDSPVFDLRAEGGLAEQDPMIQQMLNDELAKEIEGLNRDAEDFRFYPVLSIGIGVGF